MAKRAYSQKRNIGYSSGYSKAARGGKRNYTRTSSYRRVSKPKGNGYGRKRVVKSRSGQVASKAFEALLKAIAVHKVTKR